jgi:pyroglutamyl-peptidase
MFVQLHFGVNSGATRFAIERQAVNEATFRCPDELGWKPQVRLEIGIVDAFLTCIHQTF